MKKIKIYLVKSIILVTILFIYGCSYNTQEEDNNPSDYVYKIPESVDGDLEVGNINDVGINQDIITSFFNKHINGQFEYLHSLLIMKKGKLVVEEYFKGNEYIASSPITWRKKWMTFDRNTQHYMASVTKSFISALIGICIDKKLIKDIDQPIIRFFPEYKHLFDENKSKITIKHLLIMKSGISWRTGETHDGTLMIDTKSWVEYVLSRPMDSEPGEKWQYNSGLSVMLADIVSRVSGVRADLFAKEHLLDPLGISPDTLWVVNENNEVGGGWGLFMLPRDMMKFGKLFLQKGNWKGTQLISEEWVGRSWDAHHTPNLGSTLQYGLHWWTSNYDFNSINYKALEAIGAGGQRIYIIPALDLVVVFTMGDYDNKSTDARIQMQNYIIPACI